MKTPYPAELEAAYQAGQGACAAGVSIIHDQTHRGYDPVYGRAKERAWEEGWIDQYNKQVKAR